MSRKPGPPVTEPKFMSYTELRRSIVNKMKDGRKGIRDCDTVDIAIELIKLRLPRSPGIPSDTNVFDDMTQLQFDIIKRHAEFCNGSRKHPSAFE